MTVEGTTLKNVATFLVVLYFSSLSNAGSLSGLIYVTVEGTTLFLLLLCHSDFVCARSVAAPTCWKKEIRDRHNIVQKPTYSL
jgi:hypothetical protein